MFDPDYDLFCDIIEAGSISAAARIRGTSPAALSKRLSALEQRMGVHLIHRTTRRLSLTAAGKEFHDGLLSVRTSLSALEDRITGGDLLMNGRLSLTVPTSFGRMHVVPALPSFLQRFQDIDLAIELSDDFTDLQDGKHDLAIRITSSFASGLVGVRLGTNHRVLCAAPSYLQNFGMPRDLKDLTNHRLLATRAQMPWQLNGPTGQVAYHGRCFIQTGSSEAVRELALAGCGIALRSLWDVAPALEAGDLCRVLPEYEGSHDVGIYAIHAPARPVPERIKAMIRHLQEHLSATRAHL